MLNKTNKIDDILEILQRVRLDEDKAVKYLIVSAYDYLSNNHLIEGNKCYFPFNFKIDIPHGFKENLLALLNGLTLEEVRALIKESLNKVSYSYKWSYGGSTSQMGELAYRLLNLNEGYGDILYIPCSGVGYPLIPIIEAAKRDNIHFKEIYCDDINNEACYLQSLIVNIFYDASEPITVQASDMLKNNISYYNKTVLYGPLGIKLFEEKENKKNSSIFNDISFKSLLNTEWAFIDKILANTIKDDFRALVLVCGKTLWENNSSEYRKRIIESGYLEGVIELPSKSLTYTGISTYLLVLSNGNKKVKFLDASQMIIKNAGRFSERERISSLDLGLILDRYCDDSNRLNIDEAKNLKNLTPSIVNVKKYELENPTPLNEVAEVFHGNQYTLKNFRGLIVEAETGTSILTSNDIDNYSINTNSLTHIRYEDNKFDKYCLRYGDVVVTSKSSKVKVGVVNFKPKEKIIVTGGMIIVRPKLEKLNPTYLKIFLDSEAGQNALKTIQKGAYIVSLNAKDLSEVKIPLVNLERQKKTAEKFNRTVSNIIAFKRELEDLETSIKNILKEG